MISLEVGSYLPHIGYTLSAMIAFGVALTARQRRLIIERDDGKPAMRHYDEARGWHTGGYCGEETCDHLQVHHIDTQRNGGGNTSDNLITLAQCEHTGVCPARKIIGGVRNGKYTNAQQFVVHPDIREAMMNYTGDSSSFSTIFKRRDQCVENGETYHNDDHDSEMAETALANTLAAIARGWRYD